MAGLSCSIGIVILLQSPVLQDIVTLLRKTGIIFPASPPQFHPQVL